MSTPEHKNVFQNLDQAGQYVESVRALYRQGDGSYQGNRNEEQRLIAEVTSDEAHLIIDGVMAGVLAMQGLDMSPESRHAVERGGHSWNDFRNEFGKMLTGFGVITNRLHREGYDVPEYADLAAPDRMKAASVLLSDFLAHNALRFGADSAGVKKTVRQQRHTDDGGIETVSHIVDKDLARHNRDISENMRKRNYRSGAAAHPALKISPAEYKKLRREFPEIDKDDFDYAISHYRNVRRHFEETE